MTSLTITKTGRIDLDTPIEVVGVRLNVITIYMTMYNVPTSSVYRAKGSNKDVVIPPGEYTYTELGVLLLNDFRFDKQTLKVSIAGTLTGGLRKLIDENNFLYLTPLCLHLRVHGIDTSRNLFNGKRSDLLSIIPIGGVNSGKIYEYQPISEGFKKMYGGRVTNIGVEIKDEYGNDYRGKFVAELEFLTKDKC